VRSYDIQIHLSLNLDSFTSVPSYVDACLSLLCLLFGDSSSRFCADIRSQLENDFVHSLQAEVSNFQQFCLTMLLLWIFRV